MISHDPEISLTYDDARRATAESVSGNGLVGTGETTYFHWDENDQIICLQYDAAGRQIVAKYPAVKAV